MVADGGSLFNFKFLRINISFILWTFTILLYKKCNFQAIKIKVNTARAKIFNNPK